MKNNVISLYRHTTAVTEKESFGASYHSRALRDWIATVTETIFTLTICGCSLFCVYLAFTML